jgi:hypothetical protein
MGVPSLKDHKTQHENFEQNQTCRPILQDQQPEFNPLPSIPQLNLHVSLYPSIILGDP